VPPGRSYSPRDQSYSEAPPKCNGQRGLEIPDGVKRWEFSRNGARGSGPPGVARCEGLDTAARAARKRGETSENRLQPPVEIKSGLTIHPSKATLDCTATPLKTLHALARVRLLETGHLAIICDPV